MATQTPRSEADWECCSSTKPAVCCHSNRSGLAIELDEHQVRRAGLLSRLLRQGEASVWGE
jgi:hypothetical protein